jgi:hypothetical protein
LFAIIAALVGLLGPSGYSQRCGNNSQDAPCCECEEGHSPVKIYTGDVVRKINDLEIWGGVGDKRLVFQRIGTSRSIYNIGFGYGHNWRHCFEYRLTDNGTDSNGNPRLMLTYEAGIHRFTKINSTTWQGYAGVGNFITENGNEFTVQQPNGDRYVFEKITSGGTTKYLIQKLIDPNGNEYVFQNNGGGKVTRVTEPGGGIWRSLIAICR